MKTRSKDILIFSDNIYVLVRRGHMFSTLHRNKQTNTHFHVCTHMTTLGSALCSSHRQMTFTWCLGSALPKYLLAMRMLLLSMYAAVNVKWKILPYL